MLPVKLCCERVQGEPFLNIEIKLSSLTQVRHPKLHSPLKTDSYRLRSSLFGTTNFILSALWFWSFPQADVASPMHHKLPVVELRLGYFFSRKPSLRFWHSWQWWRDIDPPPARVSLTTCCECHVFASITYGMNHMIGYQCDKEMGGYSFGILVVNGP